MDTVAELTDPKTDPLASDLVVACEAVWRSIQSHHPELPPVVMLLGTGVERGRLVKLGHWWGGRWLADGDVRGEVLLAGEALHLKPEDVFEVLLHEAAHGINAARGIKDTSRGGRYHNLRFKATAIEVGLDVEQMDPYGFAKTSVGPKTAAKYAAEIDHLASVMRIARRIPQTALASGELGPEKGNGQPGAQGPRGENRRQQIRPAECGCGRRMRMAPSVLARGPVTCGNCGSDFVVKDEAERTGTLPPTATGSKTRSGKSRSVSEEIQAEKLLEAETNKDDGLEVIMRLGRWRGALNTDNEHQISVRNEAERIRWTQLARAVLTIEGLLQGEGMVLSDGMEVRCGERLLVSRSVGDSLPDPGTPGVVVDVRHRDGLVMVDFATAGVYPVSPETPAAAALSYDYCEPLPSPSAVWEAPVTTEGASVDDLDADLGIDL